MLLTYSQNARELDRQMPKLVYNFGNKWVGYHKGEVISAHESLKDVLDYLKETNRLQVAAVAYVTDKPKPRVLRG